MTSEQQEQVNLIRWTQAPDVRAQYPDLKLIYHVPNERKCSPRQGAMFKAMGVKSGVPDLCLPVPRAGYHGLYIELKAPSGAKASPNQLWWMDELLRQGYAACVCRGWEPARDAILRYMNLEEECL